MKVVVSAMGTDLDAQMDPRFGRCACFILVDTDTLVFEALENPNVMAAGGAGIQSAQLIANRGAEVVLTGNVGPNAFQTLSALGVKIVTGVTGTVRDAVERFKGGEFQEQMASQPTVSGHYGMGVPPGAGGGMGGGMGVPPGAGGGMGGGTGVPPGAGGGMGGGRGMGMGGGMGGGRGMGMGRGMGRGRGMGGAAWQQMPQPPVGTPQPAQQSPSPGSQEDLGTLRGVAQQMMEELKRINERIDRLEQGSQE